MIISNQKRLAADILSRREGRTVGIHRIWINPDYLDDVTNAVQKDDIRQLIEEGVIKARPLVGNSRGRARKAEAQKAKGRRKGTWLQKGDCEREEPKKAQVDEDHPRSTKGIERNAHGLHPDPLPIPSFLQEGKRRLLPVRCTPEEQHRTRRN